MTFFELVDLGTVLHGAVITLQGRITRVDRDPESDTIVSTDCFFLTDGTRTARILMLDPQAFVLRVGSDIMVHRILCTRTSATSMLHLFASSDTTITVSSAPRNGPLLGNGAQGDDVRSPRASISAPHTSPERLPSTSAAPSASLATPVKKRAREDNTCPAGCDAPSKPFCCLTGRPHAARCDVCLQLTAGKPFCPETGIQHL